MIDIGSETLIAVRDVPHRLPPRGGRKVHLASVYRWLSRGIRGHRLESITVGGSTYTSLEALQRWAERLSAGDTSPPPAPATRAARRRAIAQAERELAAAGI